jgi:3-methyladenine DNA glycosylase AlkD
MNLTQLKKDLRSYSRRKRASTSSRFFKTGKGEYAEGDKFIGASAPNSRKVAKKNALLPLGKNQKLVSSKVHEERFVALLILIEQYRKGNPELKEKIFNFYLKNMIFVNNWDLVDISSHKIIGDYLFENPHCTTKYKSHTFKGTKLLNHLAKSKNLWERRIAIISTFAFIRNEKFDLTLEISKILVSDKHDLIHKAVGWMLREVGKKSQETEETFLKKHYKNMPRTMLRYAIERFEENLRLSYLTGKVKTAPKPKKV